MKYTLTYEIDNKKVTDTFDTFEEAIEAINKLNLKYYVLKREELANVLEKKHKERLLKYDK